MATSLEKKLLKYSDEHQDCCFLSMSDSLHVVIAKKYGLSVYSVDNDSDEHNINSNCIIDNISIKYKAKIRQIMTIQRQSLIENVLKRDMDSKYKCYFSILCEWDSILILFENGHFCWVYIDLYNEITINEKENSIILWMIAPNTNDKYDQFLNELSSRSSALSLHINDWRFQSIYVRDKHALILSIYSFLGNVIMIIPIIWNNMLCFNCLDQNNDDILMKTKHDKDRISCLWQIRSIYGIIWDFKFIRTTINDNDSISIHFMVLYTQNNQSKILSDCFELFENENNKLMMNKNVDIESIRNISIFCDETYNISLLMNDKCVIPIQIKSLTVHKLQEILNNDTMMMMLSDQNSIHIQILKKIIKNEIIIKRNNNEDMERYIHHLFPKQIVILTDYDAVIVFDFAIVHYEESPYNKTKTKTYTLPWIGGDITIDNMIVNVLYDEVLSLLWIATLNGNIYRVGLDGIRHRQIELIEYNVFMKLKYTNVDKMLLYAFNDDHFGFIFGELSSHRLFMYDIDEKEREREVFIPQYNGVFDITKAKTDRLFSDEAMYIGYGCNMGGCIGKYQCIIPTQSMLDEVQTGFDLLSSILNVNDKLLIFVIADQTRIRSVSDSSLPELQIKDFESNAQTLSVGYITPNILLQITIDALLVIDIHNGMLTHFCVKYDDDSNITYADIEGNLAAIIVTKHMQNDHELYLYQLSEQDIIKLIYRVQLKHENISNIKIIIELMGVMIATYDGTLEMYHYKSMTPTLSTSLNHLPFDDHKENTEPKENIVAQSIVIVDHKLYIGTRNGWLIQYDFTPNTHHINVNKAILRNIGDLPVILVPIQLNIIDQEMNPLNLTQFDGKNALLCISERCWILFQTKEYELQLWPLNYPPNCVSYATSFNQDGDSYLILIINGSMDIVRVVLEPRLHCCYRKIGHTVTQIVHLQQTNNLLYITQCNDDSILNFIDKDLLFYDDLSKNVVEYEAVLSNSMVADINIVNDCYNILLALNVVSKKCFKKCIGACIVLIKAEYDCEMKKVVKLNELFRYNLSDYNLSMPYNVISFKMRDVTEEIMLVSMGSELLLFAIKECKLIKCGSCELGDFVKDIIYDASSELLSVLYEKNGIDIMKINIKKSDDLELILSNIIKSWNGVFYSSKHLLLNCLKNEKNVIIETLICDRMGNISLMMNIDEEEKRESDGNHILEHKCGLYSEKNSGGCVNGMIKCKLSHNDKCKIIAICTNGCLFEIILKQSNLM